MYMYIVPPCLSLSHLSLLLYMYINHLILTLQYGRSRVKLRSVFLPVFEKGSEKGSEVFHLDRHYTN